MPPIFEFKEGGGPVQRHEEQVIEAVLFLLSATVAGFAVPLSTASSCSLS